MNKNLLTLIASVLLIGNAHASLIISQYIEGSSNNKAIELWNVTGSTIDFSTTNLSVDIFFNGNSSSGNNITVSSGTLTAGDVITLGDDGYALSPSLDVTDTGGFWNGDDAIQITLGAVITDIFGVIGSDPGSEWNGSGASTQNNTLSLADGIVTGISSNPASFDGTRWIESAMDDTTGLGVAPAAIPEPSSAIFIALLGASTFLFRRRRK